MSTQSIKFSTLVDDVNDSITELLSNYHDACQSYHNIISDKLKEHSISSLIDGISFETILGYMQLSFNNSIIIFEQVQDKYIDHINDLFVASLSQCSDSKWIFPDYTLTRRGHPTKAFYTTTLGAEEIQTNVEEQSSIEGSLIVHEDSGVIIHLDGENARSTTPPEGPTDTSVIVSTLKSPIKRKREAILYSKYCKRNNCHICFNIAQDIKVTSCKEMTCNDKSHLSKCFPHLYGHDLGYFEYQHSRAGFITEGILNQECKIFLCQRNLQQSLMRLAEANLKQKKNQVSIFPLMYMAPSISIKDVASYSSNRRLKRTKLETEELDIGYGEFTTGEYSDDE